MTTIDPISNWQKQVLALIDTERVHVAFGKLQIRHRSGLFFYASIGERQWEFFDLRQRGLIASPVTYSDFSLTALGREALSAAEAEAPQ